MRKPKYRAWDTKFEKMYEDKYIGKHWDDWDLQTLFPSGDKAECVLIDGKRIILMQYTGLKDKNGKEMYEGDIIEHDPNPEDYTRDIIVFNEGAFSLKNDDNLNSLEYEEFKVIGNIYENPDIWGPSL